MKLAKLVQLERDAKRFAEILTILAKHGLADWISGIDYAWLKKLLPKRSESTSGETTTEITREARIRLTLSDLGTTFIKLGQILSTRPDLVGHELAGELSLLQSHTPSDPLDKVRETLTAELGAPPEDLFEEFDYSAIASASIGQVHRARLKNGRQVVVKVQHAGIQKTIIRDLDIFVGLAELAEKHAKGLKSYRPVATATEFRRVFLRELDFSQEVRHLNQFRENFSGDKGVHVPMVFPELSSRRVLTMEFLDGITVEETDRLRQSGADLAVIARRGANMYLDMIFRDGFFHADPHPGNLMVLPDGVIGVLDCGMVGRVDERLREDIETMLFAALEKDAAVLTEIVVRLGQVPAELDHAALQSDMDDFVAEYGVQSLKDFDLSGALTRMIDIIRRYEIILPVGCSLLLKVLIMLEGTSRLLQPEFSLAEVIRPYYMKAMVQRYSPRRLLHRLQRSYRDWSRLVGALPNDLSDILARLRSGELDVHLQHRRLDAIVNRLVTGILTAALFLGSAQILSLEVPPLVGGVSAIGALGCGVAIALGVRLFIVIKKTGSTDGKD